MASKESTKSKRKFLKAIYAIQEKFGVGLAGVSRTFSFGIKPTPEERKRLEEWFRQIGSARKNLYQEIFEHFKKSPSQYLGKKFDYTTFFKGSTVFKKAKKDYPLLTTRPAIEGLRNEISIPSFITNHKRHFKESQRAAGAIQKQVERNTEAIKKLNLDFDFDVHSLVANLKKLAGLNYNTAIRSYANLQRCDKLIEDTNTIVGKYNYELNQSSNSRRKDGLEMLDEIGRLDMFPGIQERDRGSAPETVLNSLRDLARENINSAETIRYVAKTAKKSERRAPNRRLSFERRLAYWLAEHKNNESCQAEHFLRELDRKIDQLREHVERKPYDAANKNAYFGLLALRARLAHPDKTLEINTLKSRLSGSFLRVRGEREVITLPGFSWDAKKPLKNVALAFREGRLYICVSASAKPFAVGANSKNGENLLRFVKTKGGSRKKAARKPKTIEYVQGSFDTNGDGLPLFLPLHFGKSHARRYIMNKRWGPFSETPNIFLNTARLKRTKKNPGDPWQYFLDITLSADKKTFGFKDFQKEILSRAKTVIGIDRGEVNPIAYAVVDKRNSQVIKRGTLGRETYVEKLKAYDTKRKLQQSRGKTISKSLRAKISRLQKTALETAVSEIIALAAEYQAVLAMEDLGGRFRGKEESLIPKKTYKRIENLLASALNFAGLLRIGNKGPVKYWGGFVPVIAAGTSQTCTKCGIRWRANKPSDDKKKRKTTPPPFIAVNDVVAFSREQEFKNVDVRNGMLVYDDKKLSLNNEWKTYSRLNPQGKIQTIDDLGKVIQEKKYGEAEYLLKKALDQRPIRDIFICHACGFSGDADENAAVNIARRGIARIDWLLTK